VEKSTENVESQNNLHSLDAMQIFLFSTVSKKSRVVLTTYFTSSNSLSGFTIISKRRHVYTWWCEEKIRMVVEVVGKMF